MTWEIRGTAAIYEGDRVVAVAITREDALKIVEAVNRIYGDGEEEKIGGTE
jgi:hypothetical protein